MHISGAVTFQATRERTWQFLASPYEMSRCVPGLAAWEIIAPDKKFQLELVWKPNGSTGAVRVPVLLEWVAVIPFERLDLAAQLTFGSIPITGTGSMALSGSGQTETELAFTADIAPPNKILEQIIRNTAPKFIDAFFKSCKDALEF